MKRVSWLAALAGALVGAAAFADDTPAHSCPHAVSDDVFHSLGSVDVPQAGGGTGVMLAPGPHPEPPSRLVRWWVPEPDGVVAMVGAPTSPWPVPPPRGVWRVVVPPGGGGGRPLQAIFPATALRAVSAVERPPGARAVGIATVQLDDRQPTVVGIERHRIDDDPAWTDSLGGPSGTVLEVLLRARGEGVDVVVAAHPAWLARQPSARRVVLDFGCVGGWRVEIELPGAPGAARRAAGAGPVDTCRSYPVERNGEGVVSWLAPPGDEAWATVLAGTDGASVLWNQYLDRAFATCAARRPHGVCGDGHALRLAEMGLGPSWGEAFFLRNTPGARWLGQVDLVCGYVCSSCPGDEARYRLTVWPTKRFGDGLEVELRYDPSTWERIP